MATLCKSVMRHARKLFRKMKHYEPVTYNIYPLTPISSHRLSIVKKKILVLDLDETLIHSSSVTASSSPYSNSGGCEKKRSLVDPDFELEVIIEKQLVKFHVFKRPYVDKFLEIVSQWYDVVVFTAGIDTYGEMITNRLDNNRGIFKRKFFRRHCTPELGLFSKDLSVVSNDLSSIFILDNSPFAYRNYPHNGIQIKSWYTDQSDKALLNLLPVLDAMRFVHDVRSVLCRNRIRRAT
jgi:CTD nuclear envelope phosphatase 1